MSHRALCHRCVPKKMACKSSSWTWCTVEHGVQLIMEWRWTKNTMSSNEASHNETLGMVHVWTSTKSPTTFWAKLLLTYKAFNKVQYKRCKLRPQYLILVLFQVARHLIFVVLAMLWPIYTICHNQHRHVFLKHVHQQGSQCKSILSFWSTRHKVLQNFVQLRGNLLRSINGENARNLPMIVCGYQLCQLVLKRLVFLLKFEFFLACIGCGTIGNKRESWVL